MVLVELAWNDNNGDFGDALTGIEISDEVRLYGPLPDGVEVKLSEKAPTSSFVKGSYSFSVFGETFPFTEWKRWLGNMAWDGVWMQEDDAKRLIAKAIDCGFDLEEWATDSPYLPPGY